MLCMVYADYRDGCHSDLWVGVGGIEPSPRQYIRGGHNVVFLQRREINDQGDKNR
jgi:hypothetical protein